MMASEWIDITVPIRNDLIHLPPKFDHSDGASARAVLRARSHEEGQL